MAEGMYSGMAAYFRKNKVALVSTVVVGLLAYTYAFTNKFLNWDDVSFFFSKGATISSGRWALPLMSLVFPDFSMPWIYGVISLVLIGMANAILVQELKIRSIILQILFSGLVIVFPSFISTVPFMFTLSSYAFAFLLSAAAISCANSHRKWVNILGIVASTVSMGIYQVYLSVTSSFFLVCMIRLLAIEKKNAKFVVMQGLKYLLHLVATCGAYLLITYLIQNITETGYSVYAQDRMDWSGIFSLVKIKRAYTVFVTELLYGEYGFMSTLCAKIFQVIAFAVTGGVLLQWARASKKLVECALMAIIIVLLPLSISCFLLIISNDMIQSMFLFGYIATYGLVCMVIDQCVHVDGCAKIRNLLMDITTLALSVIMVCNIFVANQAFLKLQIANMNVYSFYTSLMTRIQESEDFQKTGKIALIGDADNFVYDLSNFEESGMPPIRALGFSPNIYSREEYLKYFIGFDVEHATDKEIEEIIQTEEFGSMSAYPYAGSISNIGNITVIKFSDPLAENNQP